MRIKAIPLQFAPNAKMKAGHKQRGVDVSTWRSGGNVKLRDQDVREIRAAQMRRGPGQHPIKDLANKYGVTEGYIRGLRAGLYRNKADVT